MGMQRKKVTFKNIVSTFKQSRAAKKVYKERGWFILPNGSLVVNPRRNASEFGFHVTQNGDTDRFASYDSDYDDDECCEDGCCCE